MMNSHLYDKIKGIDCGYVLMVTTKLIIILVLHVMTTTWCLVTRNDRACLVTRNDHGLVTRNDYGLVTRNVRLGVWLHVMTRFGVCLLVTVLYWVCKSTNKWAIKPNDSPPWFSTSLESSVPIKMSTTQQAETQLIDIDEWNLSPAEMEQVGIKDERHVDSIQEEMYDTLVHLYNAFDMDQDRQDFLKDLTVIVDDWYGSV